MQRLNPDTKGMAVSSRHALLQYNDISVELFLKKGGGFLLLQILRHRMHCVQVRFAMSLNGNDYGEENSYQGRHGKQRIEPPSPGEPSDSAVGFENRYATGSHLKRSFTDES
jgi:hypothetical protein